MAVFRRGEVWWFKFYFAGRLIRESSKSSSKTVAKEAEKQKRRELEAGYHNINQQVREQRIRSLRSYELVITLHTLRSLPGRKRPEVESTLLFRGKDGVLPFDLWKGKHRDLRGRVAPVFYDRAGEVISPPCHLEEAIRKLIEAVCCIG